MKISWQTESQTEHAWFVLQRRENSKEWTDIYRCKGAGTTTEPFSYGYSDHSVIPGKKYRYRLRNISYSGEIDSSGVRSVPIPGDPSARSPRFFLKSVYPNPFNPRISIDLYVLQTGRVRITVHSLAGKCTDIISDKLFAPGEHRIHWEPGDLPAGIYILRMTSGTHSETRKLLYMK
ncbi:MAG: T9SS type A sorting domain-containing protein [Candidatus Marinimicrobia bacterium]|nr:T9SS type A sorting domain-containing protein [Candidatus Neomarinimicrobiota bacterium]